MVNIIQILCYRQIVTFATNGLHNCYTLFFSTNALGHMLATDSTNRIITGQHCDCLNSFQEFHEKRKAEGNTTFCECFAVYLCIYDIFLCKEVLDLPAFRYVSSCLRPSFTQSEPNLGHIVICSSSTVVGYIIACPHCSKLYYLWFQDMRCVSIVSV